jgi:hypothetical protein
VTGPATYRADDESVVLFPEALEAWVAAARVALERTAGTYGAYMTYKELAEEVQTASGIRTRVLLTNWIGKVLGPLAQACHAAGEPLLPALCVRSDETVGPTYAAALVEINGGDPPEDPDMHAAIERFNCYTYFGAKLPEGGGKPALTKKVAAARARAKKQVPPNQASRPSCPICHLMLPITGQCDNCS